VEAVAYLAEVVQVADGEILNKAEEERLVGLIRTIERKTTGEIRVHITKHVTRLGVIQDANRAFLKLGMDKTERRNGVLLYIAVKDHELACIGDEGVHKIVGDNGWQHIVTSLQDHFKKGDYYLGLHKAVVSIGSILETHFPGQASVNELPDEISRD
jgi:uncharacterized membrane protein